MSRTRNLVLGIGLGAGLMYLLDPQQGRRRRALLRDKMVKMRNDLEDTVQGKSKYASDKAHGMVAETRGKVQDIKESVQNMRTPQAQAG